MSLRSAFKKVTPFFVAFGLGLSGFAIALQGDLFPIGTMDSEGNAIKVGWSANTTGGLVFNGDNTVAPTVEVVNTRDGGGPRAPVFSVTGRSEPKELDKSPPLSVVSSIENHAGLELTRGSRKSWTLLNTKSDGLVLRKEGAAGNWTVYSFFQFNENDGTWDKFCPQDRSPDVGNHGSPSFDYVVSFNPKVAIVSNCPDEV